jgi:aminopeptidase 2
MPFSLHAVKPRHTLALKLCISFHRSCATMAPSIHAAIKHPQREVLPTTVIPTHYRLSLTPDFATFKFAGILDVKLDVTKPTSSIVLNALELELHSAKVDVAGKSIASKKIALDEDKQTATFDLEEELKVAADSTTLSIAFTGILNDKMAGFYRSSYIDKTSGEKKWLATTQMEPTDARRAFPCWVYPLMNKFT